MNRRIAVVISLIAAAILWTVTMVFMVRNANAATVTLSTGASCEVGRVIIEPKTRDVLVQCKTATVPPVTVPVEPAPAPPVTPPPVVAPPVATVCPQVGYTPRPLGNPGVSTVLTINPGQVIAFPITGSGLFQLTTEGLASPGASVELGISKCPGDFSYYKSRSGVPAQGCGGISSASGGAMWAPLPPSFKNPYCTVPAGETWYINLRMTDCTYCQIFYSWR